MRGDSIVVESHHQRAAEGVHALLRQRWAGQLQRCVISVAGESGAGKSEVAEALGRCIDPTRGSVLVMQQDDYFVHPPISNDAVRRSDIGWVGPGEVRLSLMDTHLRAFRDRETVLMPMVRYQEDRIDEEEVDLSTFEFVIAEGTYVSLLQEVDIRVFITRDFHATRAHREKRRRHASELDPFIDRVLEIEHEIIAAHRARADILIHEDYSVSWAGEGPEPSDDSGTVTP